MSMTYKAANPQLDAPLLVPRKHYGPVTNIKFYDNDMIFASNGPNLQLYAHHTLVKTVRIFKRQKIHGIEISKDKQRVIFFGGRSFAVVGIEEILADELELKVKECAVNDWITAMSFDFGLENCYVLTSHNVVYTIDLLNLKISNETTFFENSILYSGSIKVFEDRVIIASGTILGGVFIWDLFSNKLIHNLIGHEGAIFGVTVSPTGDFVCSCSDDRSIRVWSLDTGSNVATGWGHNSRIWQLQWFNGNRIMSCSEDCTARVWEFVENSENILYCNDVWELHQGKHIWCGDVNEAQQLAVTGGADGRIRLIDLAVREREDNWKREFPISAISEEKGDYFKSYVQFSTGLIVITALGRCYKLKNYKEWEFLFKDDDLSNFQILNSFKKQNLVLITSRTGSTTVLKFDEAFNLVKKIAIPKPLGIRGKVTNVLTAEKSEDSFLIFYESPNPNDDLVVHELDFKLLEEPIVFLLPKPDTRFISTCMSYDHLNDILFLGSRFTTFIVYKLDRPEEQRYWKKFVKGDTITSCSIVSSSPNEIVVLITIRDGDYFYVRIDSQFNLEVLQHNRIQKGFLEGAYLDHDDNLILLTFKSDTFHLWNETRQLEIFKEQCGGSHRTWNLDEKEHKNHNYNFIYNKASNLIIVNTGEQPFADSCLSNGTHGREIRDISIASTLRTNESKVVLTGAEDTTVKLSQVSASGSILNFVTQRKHTSGLQKVKFIEGSQYAITSAAREEFFVWKVNDSYKKLGPLMTCYASLPPSSSEPDLRIMDFDTLSIFKDGKLYGWLIMNVYSDSTIKVFEFNISTKQFKLVLEDRYSTCCLWDTKFILKFGEVYGLIGGTDGHIAIYRLTPELTKLYSIVEDRSLELKEQPELEIDPEIEAEIGTKFETIPLFPELIIKQQVHQSGIKSFVLIQYPLEKAVIDLVTGGDDNALVHTRLHFENETIRLELKSFKESAASCTITSLSLLEPDEHRDRRRFIAVSVDQIARLWELDHGQDAEGELKCIDSRYTTIGDTGSSDVSKIGGKNIALIGGAGLSSWEVKL